MLNLLDEHLMEIKILVGQLETEVNRLRKQLALREKEYFKVLLENQALKKGEPKNEYH